MRLRPRPVAALAVAVLVAGGLAVAAAGDGEPDEVSGELRPTTTTTERRATTTSSSTTATTAAATTTTAAATATEAVAPSPDPVETPPADAPAPAPAPVLPGVPVSGTCPMFPSDSFWHADVRGLPVHPMSATWRASIGTGRGIHPDFGSGTWDGGPIGIPFVVVPASQPGVAVSFEYADESDAGPYPVPADPPIEGGPQAVGDRHVLVVQEGTCTLSELYAAHPNGDGSWSAGSGAVWDLRSNALRPDGWTSADAAGLAILPGLVRYDEVAAGVVDHAIRFTAPSTQDTYLWPARHQAGVAGAHLPPMGTWMRLRADIDPASFPPQVQPIVTAMQVHGLLLADNGSSMYVSGAPDERWDDDQLRTLGRITAADFEVVDASGLQVSGDSGATRP